MLQIEATDEANNKAVITHNFSINYLAPIIAETPSYLCTNPIVPVIATGTSTLYNRAGTGSFIYSFTKMYSLRHVLYMHTK